MNPHFRTPDVGASARKARKKGEGICRASTFVIAVSLARVYRRIKRGSCAGVNNNPELLTLETLGRFSTPAFISIMYQLAPRFISPRTIAKEEEDDEERDEK